MSRDEIAALSTRAAMLQHELELVQTKLRALAPVHRDSDVDRWEPETPVPRSPTDDGHLEAQRKRMAMLERARIDLGMLDDDDLARVAELASELALR